MKSQEWDKRYEEKELVWSRGPNQFVVAEVTGMTPGRALDLACGEGRNALWLSEQGWHVCGTDFSEVAIDKARARGQELGLTVDFQVADAAAEITGSYDLILLAYLHLPRAKLAQVLAVAAAALAPLGSLLIIGHDLRNIKEGVGGPQDPDILQSPEGLRELLGDLQIVRSETVFRAVEKDGQTVQALDVVVRATKKS
ncbi:MAG: class I SAM-dependent methyltransferase [Kofleriaceae bacterium]|nr:class I SAM-dependent methyltransferase [Kofleriaceae bacterium]